MYAAVLLANVTRQRDTSPMNSFNRTRYRPCPLNSLYLITDLPKCDGYDVVKVFVFMLTKRTIVEPITKTITTEQLAKVMHRVVFRHFGLPCKLMSDRDPRFMSDFWQTLVRVVGTKLNISTSYHP
jgi:hypothetical protein